MTWVERYIQPQPSEQRPTVERVRVEAAECPECGGKDVFRYPVANQHGARMATKCQDCLHALSYERPGPDDLWPPFRSVTYDWEASPAERSARENLEQRKDS